MALIQYIDTPDKLDHLCQQIATESWLALDTEFLREKTYYPKFCLLQIATPDWVVCVDPLAFKNLDCLLTAINHPHITKVFHSCRQDLEIFYQLNHKIPTPLFDTQIAAPLLGIQENPGYAMLVSTFLNINLSKAYTRTDWSRRPLSAEQLQYAADDVIYLCQIYEIMREKLIQLQRFDWLKKDFDALINPALYETHPEDAWLKIKGRKHLTGKQLSILQSLTKWREQRAKVENKPRNWLIRDDILIDLAKLQPSTVTELATIRHLNAHLVRSYGGKLCQLIQAAQEKTITPFKPPSSIFKKTPKQEAVLDVLTAITRLRADENALNPMILASRKELEKLLFNHEDCLLLTGWRFEMVGYELQNFLLGQCSLNMNAEGLTISHDS